MLAHFNMQNVVHFESILDRLPRRGGEFYIIVPDTVAKQFVTGRRPARVQCLVNGLVKFQCAIRPKGGGGFYINIGAEIRRAGKFVLGQTLFLEVHKDESEFGRDLPEELQELLEMDGDGKRLFHEALPSLRRAIIYHVSAAKSIQVRIDRAVMMINRLKIK